MAVSWDGETVGEQEITEDTSRTINHTSAGANRVAVVGLALNQSATVTAPTYGGVSCTQMATVTFEGHLARMWYYVAPATGSTAVVIAFSTSDTYGYWGVTTYQDTDQSTVYQNGATATGNASPATVNVSSSNPYSRNAVSIFSALPEV